MKKYIFLLVATIILGLVAGNKASGQVGCEVCVSPLPGSCYELTFSIPGCCDSLTAVFCYECGVTRPSITLYVAEISYCPQCEDAAWDFVHQWALDNIDKLCGSWPCNTPPPFEVYYTVPVCAEVQWNGATGRVTVRAHPGSCDKRCTEKYEWCRDYSTTPPTTQRRLVERYPSGNGTCEYFPYGNAPGTPPEYQYDPNINWRLECVRNLAKPTCPQYP
ncbi:MAG: hypothetical protein CH6_0869 [Candidatus Kapaibacterium sp.]|nr:MAG: hypothetical protein CH6_0869 [Candidatus Kapabacteria bacterium]ROL55771.1 MAG: hypothetical protein D9V84_10715 [Bacteroidetes/Chlorobi group bacterium Naka2016]